MTATASMPAIGAADLPPAPRSASSQGDPEPSTGLDALVGEFLDVLLSLGEPPADDSKQEQGGQPAKQSTKQQQPAKQKRDDDDAAVLAVASTTPIDVQPVLLESANTVSTAAPVTTAAPVITVQIETQMAAQLPPVHAQPQKLPIPLEMLTLPEDLPEHLRLDEPDTPPPATPEKPLTFAAKVVPMNTSPQEASVKPPVPEITALPEAAARPIEKHAAMPLNLSQPKDQGQQHGQEQSAKDHQAPPPPPQHAEFATPFADGPKGDIATVAPKAPSSAAAPLVEHASEPPAAPAASSNDIRVRIPDANGGSTDVRFVESGGEVRVTVRNADPELAQTLRNGVNDLSNRLSQSGLHSEIWKPAADSPSQQNSDQQPQQQPPQQQDRREQGSGNGGSRGQQRDSSSDSHRDQPGDSHRDQAGDRQNQRQEREPVWAEALAKSLRTK